MLLSRLREKASSLSPSLVRKPYPAVPVGGGSAYMQPFHAVSFLEGLSDYHGESAKVVYAPGLPALHE